PKRVEGGRPSAADRSWSKYRLRPPSPQCRRIWMRSYVVAALVLAYAASFGVLRGWIGNPAFLLGLGICVLAGACLGLRGALVVIVAIVFIDRSYAMRLPPSPEVGLTAGVIALLVKLVLAGGLGLIVDMRALRAALRRETEARERNEESLRHSEGVQSALLESVGEGVGLFDAQGRVVFANQALVETLGIPREELCTTTFSELLTEESQRMLHGHDADHRGAPFLRGRSQAERGHPLTRHRDAFRAERLV